MHRGIQAIPSSMADVLGIENLERKGKLDEKSIGSSSSGRDAAAGGFG